MVIYIHIYRSVIEILTVVQSNEYWRGCILKMMKIVVHLAKLATSIPNQIKVIHTRRYFLPYSNFVSQYFFIMGISYQSVFRNRKRCDLSTVNILILFTFKKSCRKWMLRIFLSQEEFYFYLNHII